MANPNHPLRLTPFGLVGLPLAVVTLIAALIALAAIASDQFELISPVPLLVSGALVYAATIFLLARSGFASVRELNSLASLDELSHLPNRRRLHLDIEEYSGGDDEIAVAIIDLDSFKQINDHHGHAVGDHLIRTCAGLLREACGEEATCYRLGGDEFAAIKCGPVAGTILEGICRGFIDRLAQPVTLGDQRIVVGASIGLARSPAHDRLPSSELLRRSDVAMYMSKRGGKLRCTWFNEGFDQRREAVQEIQDELRAALNRNELSLRYQPLVDATSGRIVAVESLLRWTRRDGEAISPNVFIPIAEESGAINQIGDWVLRRALSDATGWGGITLCVNISSAQLRNPEFPIKLGEALEETGFPPERLELEITETCLVLDPVVAERTLDVVRGFGVNISLDDFGTGYASIGFLRQFRFEKLKLDRSLISQADRDDGSRAMMLSSIAMARALKMQVTAEGVETAEQAEMVRLAGADQLQGWLFYRALRAQEIDRLHAAQAGRLNASGMTGTNRANRARHKGEAAA